MRKIFILKKRKKKIEFLLCWGKDDSRSHSFLDFVLIIGPLQTLVYTLRLLLFDSTNFYFLFYFLYIRIRLLLQFFDVLALVFIRFVRMFSSLKKFSEKCSQTKMLCCV